MKDRLIKMMDGERSKQDNFNLARDRTEEAELLTGESFARLLRAPST